MKFIDRITEFLARKIGQDKAASLVQLACFCVVGGINTLVDTGIFSLIYYVFLGVSEALYSIPLVISYFSGNEALYPLPFAAGYLCGVACSFVLNKLVTFRDKGSAKRQWLPFLLINLDPRDRSGRDGAFAPCRHNRVIGKADNRTGYPCNKFSRFPPYSVPVRKKGCLRGFDKSKKGRKLLHRQPGGSALHTVNTAGNMI